MKSIIYSNKSKFSLNLLSNNIIIYFNFITIIYSYITYAYFYFSGEYAIMYLFMRYKFNWYEVKYSYYAAYKMITILFGNYKLFMLFFFFIKISFFSLVVKRKQIQFCLSIQFKYVYLLAVKINIIKTLKIFSFIRH